MIYISKYKNTLIVDQLDLFILSVIISFSISKLIKNRKEKKKSLDFRLIEDLKKKSKIVSSEYEQNTPKQIKKINVTNIRGGQDSPGKFEKLILVLQKIKKFEEFKKVVLIIQIFFQTRFGKTIIFVFNENKEWVSYSTFIASGIATGNLLAELTFVASGGIIVSFVFGLVIRSIYQQINDPLMESICIKICNYAAEYHNTNDQIILDPEYKANLEKFAEKLGLSDPNKPIGPWKCNEHEGSLYNRVYGNKKKVDSIDPAEAYPDFVEITKICEDFKKEKQGIRIKN